jgi:uncharacterized protein (DUF1330 family)
VSGAIVIGHISVTDPAKWSEYCAAVPATVAPWGAQVIFRGRRARLLGGEHRHSETVVLRFPDRAAVDGWFDSPAYQALLPLRRAAAEVDLISFVA